jgi:hypothetical protein
MNLIDSASLVVTPNGYKTSKLYSIVPSDGTGDMTFARTGDTATRVNPSGLIESVTANKPRLDYLGGGCPKLLLEPQRTNLANYSQEFDNAAWTKTRCSITANAIVAPDGTTTADKLIEDTTATSTHGANRIITLTDATIYTLSVFAKQGERSWIQLIDNTGNNRCTFDLNNGIIGTIGGSTASAKIESYGNGWYRCSLTFTQSGTVGRIEFKTATNSTTTSYTGDGTSGIYLWGAQVELGAYATSYIPTTTASVTRNADSCTKTSATALIGQTEGTMFFDIELDTRLTYTYLLFRDSAFVNFFGFIINQSNIQAVMTVGTGQAQIVLSNSNTGRFKLAFGYKQNDFAFYVNGTLVGTDTSGTVAATSVIDMYNNTTNRVRINSSALWKTRLQNSELATLTAL